MVKNSRVREDSRPDPDALLAAIRADEARARRGRLRIFFGMCPGVGKTYAMLEAAREKLGEGVEVVAGIVETHGRAETQALLEGIPIVPRSKTEYRGTTLEEMDFEAILLWHPRLVLVDELAHTNAPGSRHPKRYQDVFELLDAGIDVFTTLNVQHVESRTDAVRQITGVTVRETVPDSVLDTADEIEIVDLTPGQLRQRLAEGKVYLGDRAATAAENFFRENNLSALREMALRLTAEHVDRRLRAMRPASQRQARGATDRLMVAVSSSPHSAELVRWTRRYAAGLEVPWVAVAVESGKALTADDERRRTANLALARQLGAEVVLTSGVHVGRALLEAAERHGVTHIILGKPDGPLWRWIFGARSPVAWLIRHSGRIDIQLVRTESAEAAPRGRPEKVPGRWREYVVALAIAAGVTVCSLSIRGYVGYWSVALVYLLAVTVAGTTLRRGPTLLLGAASALLWNYLFIPPLYTMAISHPQDAMMFAMFFVTAIIVGHLTSRLRDRERLERQREGRTAALYRLTRDLAAATSRASAIQAVIEQVRGAFGLAAAVVLRDDAGVFGGTAHPASTWAMSAKEEGVAWWVFQNKRPAGRGTEALPDAAGLHLPLLAGDRVEGVLAVELPADRVLAPEQRELLEAFAAQLGIVAERARLAHAQRMAQMAAESERLQKTLFDTVSHELKTPVAAIRAALDQPQIDGDEIRRANDRLGRTVDQLLDASRIESGALKLHMEWCDPAELAREALAHSSLPADAIRLRVPAELPPIRVDARLVEQAISTLAHNAWVHGSATAPGTLRVIAGADSVRFEVEDDGPGLPPGDEGRVFEKFYRLPGSPPGGIGLGLSIAKRLAEAHGGTLTAANRPGGGAKFVMVLPVGGELKLPE